MLFGYARVSTSEQDTSLQIDALTKAGAERIHQEKRSGANVHRPELELLLMQLRPGDTVMVYKLDRLARSLSDLLRILARVEAAGAAFRSLTEVIDTSTPAGRMMMQLLGAFAEFERGMIRERAMAGQLAAKDRGVTFGRSRAMSPGEERECVRKWQSGRYTKTELARLYGCHISSIKRAILRVENPASPAVATSFPTVQVHQ